VDDFELCLEDLRRATHPALGAADLKDCLLLQVDAGALGHYDVDFIRTLISQHIENIVANRLPRIARATTHSLDEVKIGIEAIRSLDPWPGREYGEEPAETIHPDVIVEEFESEFQIRLTREGMRDLNISATYRKILKDAKRGDSVREWIKKRLESARWFIDALEQRQSTLERIARLVFKHQEAFLRKGVASLTPLRMQEVADEVGVHISTVSRAVAGKYVQTPHGILALRFFFTGGMEKDSGGMTSQASIKQRIKEFIEKENKSSPLSDERLADMLHEKDGLTIARRTVTKYRKAQMIPSSSQRREY
jgi:RNA polymerase sigma-54 factor